MSFTKFINTQTLRELIKSNSPIHLIDTRSASRVQITGSKSIDYLKLYEKEQNFPYLPTQEAFNSLMKDLEIPKDETLTVLYDTADSKTAAKLWFIFKIFGKSNVAVLDGGLEKWLQENREISEKNESKIQSTGPEFSKNLKFLKNFEYVAALSDLLSSSKPQTLSRIVDGRNPLRFTGLSEEKVRILGGNIPGSKNLPFNYLYNADRTVKSSKEIRKVLKDSNIDIDDSGNTIHLSTFGLSACYNILALEEAGIGNQFLYEGGWADWVVRKKPQEVPISVKQMLEDGYEKHLKKKNIKK